MLMRFVITALVTFLATQSAHALDITTCGTVVPTRTVGVLLNDIECDGIGTAVTLERAATLNLNGFTIRVTSPPPTSNDTAGVTCGPGPCTVHGPGAIEAGDDYAINLTTRTALRLSDVRLRGRYGIYANRERLSIRLSNVQIEYGRSAINSVTGGPSFSFAPKVVVDNVVVTFAPELGLGLESTIVFNSLKGDGLTFVGPTGDTNVRALDGKTVALTHLTLIDFTKQACAIFAERVKLRDSLVTGNFEFPGGPCGIFRDVATPADRHGV